jgi:hypothetical protein
MIGCFDDRQWLILSRSILSSGLLWILKLFAGDPLTIKQQRRSNWFQFVTFVSRVVMAVEANFSAFCTCMERRGKNETGLCLCSHLVKGSNLTVISTRSPVTEHAAAALQISKQLHPSIHFAL